jgi:hypothetical protein
MPTFEVGTVRFVEDSAAKANGATGRYARGQNFTVRDSVLTEKNQLYNADEYPMPAIPTPTLDLENEMA